MLALAYVALGGCITWQGNTGDDAYRTTCCRCEDHPPMTSTTKEDGSHPQPNYNPQPPTPKTPSGNKSRHTPKSPNSENPMPGKPTKRPKMKNKKHLPLPTKRPRQRTVKPNKTKKEKPGT